MKRKSLRSQGNTNIHDDKYMELKNVKMPGFLLIIHINIKILDDLLHSESNGIKAILKVR